MLEEEAQVLLRELAERSVRAVDGGVEDQLLLLLELNDLLLDGLGRNEAHRLHGARLADSVSPLDGLAELSGPIRAAAPASRRLDSTRGPVGRHGSPPETQV